MFVSAVTEAPPWLESLNPEQRCAATHAGGPLLVLAGAGTGKTTTLCARVAWLVSEGVAPERIMLLTFTRRASREMLQRTRAVIQMPVGSGGVLGGTFHSVAHRFVRLHASALGLPPGFGVLDAGDAADVIDMIREEHGHAQNKVRFPKKSTLLDAYSRTVNAQQPLADVVSESFPWCEQHVEAMAALFKAYTARKRTLGVLDLDDLLVYWHALATDEVVGPQMQEAFDHLLIDEYQDVNGLQVEIVRALRRERRELTVVGDDFQAIYGWRSASPEHILQFPAHFPEASVITLSVTTGPPNRSSTRPTRWPSRRAVPSPGICVANWRRAANRSSSSAATSRPKPPRSAIAYSMPANAACNCGSRRC
jgi:DNA helicase-2/ATP-dependent DNA helicase PcrA